MKKLSGKTMMESSISLFVKVWDTGGQERYRPVLSSCYKNAHGVIIVFDVTNEKSFANLKQVVSANLDY